MAGSSDVVAASGAVDISGTESFRDVWATQTHPAIKHDYEELMLMIPLRTKAKQEQLLGLPSPRAVMFPNAFMTYSWTKISIGFPRGLSTRYTAWQGRWLNSRMSRPRFLRERGRRRPRLA